MPSARSADCSWIRFEGRALTVEVAFRFVLGVEATLDVVDLSDRLETMLAGGLGVRVGVVGTTVGGIVKTAIGGTDGGGEERTVEV